MLNLPQVLPRFAQDPGFFPASPAEELGRLAVCSQTAPPPQKKNLGQKLQLLLN